MADLTTLLDQAIEDRYIRAILAYPKLLEITRGELVETSFSTKPKARLYVAILFYYDEFKTSPKEDLLEITIEEMFPGEQAKLVTRLAGRIWKLPIPEWNWIISKIDEHIKTIQIQKVLFEASDLLKQGAVKDARNRLVETIRSSGILTGESTNDLELEQKDIYELATNKDAFCCPTRIYALDDAIKGLFRKELFLVLAPMNVGKSWAVIHLAVSALLSGKRVLYLTLEMSKERVMQRILQNISGTYIPSHQEDHKKDVEIWSDDWAGKENHEAKSLFNSSTVHKNLETLKRFGGLLSVKEFPSGEATINEIEKEIALFDVTFDALPDVIIVDGLLDVKFSGSTDLSRQRLGLTQVARDLRRIASVYNAAVVTTHQGNRESIAAKLVGMEHTGESIGIVQVADTGISLNQTKAEHQLGKMRVSIMRARNQQKWGLVELWQNLTIGQFCQVSQKVERNEEEEEDNKESTEFKRVRVRRNPNE